MNIVYISEDNVRDFIEILNSYEFYGISAGFITCFGAYDEVKDAAAGVISLEIFPGQIQIDRIYTVPEYRGMGVEDELLEVIMDQPSGSELPIFMITNLEDILTSADGSGSESHQGHSVSEFLLSKGFVRIDSQYDSIIGSLRDMEDIPLSSTISKGKKIRMINRIPSEDLVEFILSHSHDNLIQFPELDLPPERYSDGSMVCMDKDGIEAVVLMKEMNGVFIINGIFGNDPKSIYCIFSALKSLLEKEYPPDTGICFMTVGGDGREFIHQLFKKCIEQPLEIYSSDTDS